MIKSKIRDFERWVNAWLIVMKSVKVKERLRQQK